MKKNKRTRMLRRALISSVASLILCCAMLIGTTYAWLNDSVTSGSNRIVAGTFDVRLLKYTDADDGTREYTDISGQTGDLFLDEDEKFAWEPGTEKTVKLAVKNEGNLPIKYEVGLVIKDAGLAELLEYSFVVVEDPKEEAAALMDLEDEEVEDDLKEETEDEPEYFALIDEVEHETYDEETEIRSGVSYSIISTERILVSPAQEEMIAVMAIDESEEGAPEEDFIDHYELTVRMKDIPSKEIAERVRNAQCEIDICVIATQVVENVKEDGEEPIAIPTLNVEECIYHFTTVEVEVDEENDVYKTVDIAAASASNAAIGIELPEGTWLEGDIEKVEDHQTVILSVKPKEVEREWEQEEERYKKTTTVQLYGVDEANEVPFTLFQNIGAENELVKIIYEDVANEEYILVYEREIPEETIETEEFVEKIESEYDPEEGFGYTYDPETGEINIRSIYQGAYTVVWKTPEE